MPKSTLISITTMLASVLEGLRYHFLHIGILYIATFLHLCTSSGFKIHCRCAEHSFRVSWPACLFVCAGSK